MISQEKTINNDSYTSNSKLDYIVTSVTWATQKVDQSDYRKITIHSEKVSCQS